MIYIYLIILAFFIIYMIRMLNKVRIQNIESIKLSDLYNKTLDQIIEEGRTLSNEEYNRLILKLKDLNDQINNLHEVKKKG